MTAVNEVCPVMDVEIDPENPPKTVEYEGHTIGLCCGHCVQKFEEEPEKYVKQLDLS